MGLFLRALLFATSAAAVAHGSPPNPLSSDGTLRFHYEQERPFVFSKQGPGALAYLTPKLSPTKPAPVVVFFHGLNPDEKIYPEFDSTPLDPRIVAKGLVLSQGAEPFILLAPTHSRDARGTKWMWHDFDLDRFLQNAESSLAGRATFDRSRIVLVGHSGGGCNPDGGILAPNVPVRAIVAVDTCLDSDVQSRVTTLAKSTEVFVFYQRSWIRPVDEFAKACRTAGHCSFTEVTGLASENPHREILSQTLRLALPTLLAKPSDVIASQPTTGQGESL